MVDMANPEIKIPQNHVFGHTEDSNMGIGSIHIEVPGMKAHYEKDELVDNLNEKGEDTAIVINKKLWFMNLLEAVETGKTHGHYRVVLGGILIIAGASLIGLEAKREWKDLKHFANWIEPYLKSKKTPQD